MRAFFSAGLQKLITPSGLLDKVHNFCKNRIRNFFDQNFEPQRVEMRLFMNWL